MAESFFPDQLSLELVNLRVQRDRLDLIIYQKSSPDDEGVFFDFSE